MRLLSQASALSRAMAAPTAPLLGPDDGETATDAIVIQTAVGVASAHASSSDVKSADGSFVSAAVPLSPMTTSGVEGAVRRSSFALESRSSFSRSGAAAVVDGGGAAGASDSGLRCCQRTVLGVSAWLCLLLAMAALMMVAGVSVGVYAGVKGFGEVLPSYSSSSSVTPSTSLSPSTTPDKSVSATPSNTPSRTPSVTPTQSPPTVFSFWNGLGPASAWWSPLDVNVNTTFVTVDPVSHSPMTVQVDWADHFAINLFADPRYLQVRTPRRLLSCGSACGRRRRRSGVSVAAGV